MNEQFKLLASLGYGLLVALAFRLYRLDLLPGEWYSDISALHHRVEAILAGQWPYQFNSAQGPLYHYLIAPLVYLLGPSYTTYKLLSILFSLGVILVTMRLAYAIGGLNEGQSAAVCLPGPKQSRATGCAGNLHACWGHRDSCQPSWRRRLFTVYCGTPIQLGQPLRLTRFSDSHLLPCLVKTEPHKIAKP